MKNENLLEDSYIGLTVKEAQDKAIQAGLRHRIIEEDGKAYIITADFIIGRLNFIINKGKITGIELG